MRIPRPTYGSVTATIALFAALGGTSYAAATISGSDIRNGTVTSADIKNGTLAGRDVDNGSITSADIDDGSLQAKDFKAGVLPAGPPNVVTRRADATVPTGGFASEDVSCFPGETVVGGGAGITGQEALVAESGPMETDGTRPENGEIAAGWLARGRNGTATPQTLNVFVLCATS